MIKKFIHTHIHIHNTYTHTHTYIHTHTLIYAASEYKYFFLTLYNEERRLGDQRGSDTLVVPLITSNDGLSIAFHFK